MSAKRFFEMTIAQKALRTVSNLSGLEYNVHRVFIILYVHRVFKILYVGRVR
jgi:hypothetical protein